jgi:hypothetical protein
MTLPVDENLQGFPVAEQERDVAGNRWQPMIEMALATREDPRRFQVAALDTVNRYFPGGHDA